MCTRRKHRKLEREGAKCSRFRSGAMESVYVTAQKWGNVLGVSSSQQQRMDGNSSVYSRTGRNAAWKFSPSGSQAVRGEVIGIEYPGKVGKKVGEAVNWRSRHEGGKVCQLKWIVLHGTGFTIVVYVYSLKILSWIISSLVAFNMIM